MKEQQTRKISLLLLFIATIFGLGAQENNCVQFDGTDDFIFIGDQFDLATSDFTVEAWFNINSIEGIGNAIVSKGNTSVSIPSNAGFNLYANYHETDELSFQVGDADGTVVVATYSGLENDRWYHVAGVREGSNIYLYLDGELVASNTTGRVFDISNDVPLAIGAMHKVWRSTNNLFMDGKIDEVRIWNVARSQCDIVSAKDCSITETQPNLMAAYNFNDSQLTDISGNDYNGTFESEPVFETSEVAGICELDESVVNSCMDFDGVDDYVYIGDVNDLGTSDFTVEAWVNIESIAGIGNDIVSKGNTSVSTPSNAGFNLYANYHETDEITFQIGDADGTVIRATYAGLETGTWTHIAGVREGNNIYLYVNGELVATETSSSTFNVDNNVPLAIGALHKLNLSTTNQFMDGKIDEVRIWNVAKTACEIVQNKDRSITEAQDNLLAAYNFNDATATSVPDVSGNGNDGDVVSSPGIVESEVANTYIINNNNTTVTPPPPPVVIIENSCVDFDGDNDYVLIGDVNNLGTSDFTLESWVYIEGTDGVGNNIVNKGITSVGNPSNAGYGLRASKTAADEIEFHIGDQNGETTRVLYNGIETDRWYHVAGVRRGRSLSLYLDGELVATNKTLSVYNVDTDVPLAIGAIHKADRSLTNEYMDGKIDEVRIWNTALDACAIQENMDRAIQAPEDNLIAGYNMNNITDNVVYDVSGNENNGVLRNGATYIASEVALIENGDYQAVVCEEPLMVTAPDSTVVFEPLSVTFEIVVEANSQWSATCNVDWVDLSALAGDGNEMITVAMDENTTGERRIAVITIIISQEGMLKSEIVKTITVVQDSNEITQIAECNAEGVLVYPNPAQEYVCVNSNEVALVQIFSTNNELLLEKQVNEDQNINIKELPQGVYFVTVRTADETRTSVLVKE